MNDFLQVPVLVFSTIPAPVWSHQGRRLIPQTNPIPKKTPSPEDKVNKGIPNQGKQARAVMVMVDELFAIIFLARRTGDRNQQ